jgi:hypothetical protein
MAEFGSTHIRRLGGFFLADAASALCAPVIFRPSDLSSHALAQEKFMSEPRIDNSGCSAKRGELEVDALESNYPCREQSFI